MLAGCTSQRQSNNTPALSPATQAAAPAPKKPNFVERTAATTWQTIQKPVRWIIPAKAAATEPASQPAPQAAEATIVVHKPGDDSTSPLRIPLPPPEENAATQK